MIMKTEKPIFLEEAQRRVLAEVAPLATEVVQLKDGRGRVLAEEIRASQDEPQVAQVAMDGYAVRSGDVKSASPEEGILLAVVGVVSAGQQSHLTVKRGEAIRVMTGGSVPKGADAVVPQEATETVAGGIRVLAPVAPRQHLIPVGAEFRRDQHLISSGTILQPKELSILATLGYTTVTVWRRPEVAVLATGSELVEVGKKLKRGEVFASNVHMVAHLVSRCGGMAIPLGIAGDNLDNLSAAIQRGMEADLVVTTGGTGKGDKDLLSAAVATLNGELCFRGIAMTPGKQTLFAKLGETLLFGLPGRPPATYIAFEQLVRPALLRMLGISQPLLPEIAATLCGPIQVRGKVLSFLFCRLIFKPNGPEVTSLRSETKGIFAEMLAANGLLKIPPGRDRLEEGSQVRVQLLDLGLDGLSYFSESKI